MPKPSTAARINALSYEFQELKNQFAETRGEWKSLQKTIYGLWVPAIIGVVGVAIELIHNWKG